MWTITGREWDRKHEGELVRDGDYDGNVLRSRVSVFLPINAFVLIRKSKMVRYLNVLLLLLRTLLVVLLLLLKY